jgi:hypothetical protein
VSPGIQGNRGPHVPKGLHPIDRGCAATPGLPGQHRLRHRRCVSGGAARDGEATPGTQPRCGSQWRTGFPGWRLLRRRNPRLRDGVPLGQGFHRQVEIRVKLRAHATGSFPPSFRGDVPSASGMREPCPQSGMTLEVSDRCCMDCFLWTRSAPSRPAPAPAASSTPCPRWPNKAFRTSPSYRSRSASCWSPCCAASTAAR